MRFISLVIESFQKYRYEVFGVADLEFEVRFLKLKMADPMWHTEINEMLQNPEKMCYGVFWGHSSL